MQLRSTVNKEDKIYVVISDHSKNAKTIYSKLKEVKYFEDVWYYETEKEVNHSNIWARLKVLWRSIFGRNVLQMPKDLQFDEIIGYNLDIPAHLLYAYCKKKNKNLVCNRFEEGIFSYHTQLDNCGELKLIYKVRSLLGKTNMRDEPKKFYCFTPAFYKGDLETVQIPKIQKTDEEFKKLLVDIFEIPQNCNAGCKYLYLPCIYDMEGGEPIGELKLALKISNMIGRELLLVKPHPRDDKNKYIKAGLLVDQVAHVPLEALIICGYYQNMTLLTALSGSLLTVFNLFQMETKGYYLYEYCDISGNDMAMFYSRVLNEYLDGENANFNGITILQREE